MRQGGVDCQVSECISSKSVLSREAHYHQAIVLFGLRQYGIKGLEVALLVELKGPAAVASRTPLTLGFQGC